MQSKERLIFALSLLFWCVALGNTPKPLSLLLAVVIHECGHFLAARLVGARVSSFGMRALRLSIRYDGTNIGYVAEAFVCAGGALANLVSAAASLIFGQTYFTECSVALSLINLLPVGPLDGGGILRALAKKYLTETAAESVCRGISTVFALALFVFASLLLLLTGEGISLFFLSLYLLSVTFFGRERP